LAAAMRLFAEKGYAATSLSEIGEASGVGKGLVAYHFGSKEDLRQAAMHQHLQPFFDEVDETLRTGNLIGFIEKRFRFMAANPELRRCMAWATLEADIPIRRSERQAQLEELVRQKGVAGGFRDDLDPMLVLLTATMAMDGFFRFRPITAALFPDDFARDDIEERFLSTLLQMIQNPQKS